MKTYFWSIIALLSVSFFACTKNTATDQVKTQPATSEILTGITTNNQDIGKPYISPKPVYWKINHIVYDNIDVTSRFSAFRFEFLQDQTVVAISKGNLFSISGKWYMPDRDHLVMYYDTSILPYDIEFEKFLNGEWQILKSSYFGIYLESDENKIHREMSFERFF